MSHTLQARVVGLAGAGVAIAAGVFWAITESALASFDETIRRQQAQAAAAIAAVIAHDVVDDLRVLASLAGADPAARQQALASTLRMDRMAAAVFVVAADGSVGECVPEPRCTTFARTPGTTDAARQAVASQRPVVTNLLESPRRVIAIMPFRATTADAAAAGFVVDLSDRRLEARLDDARATIQGQAALVDGAGRLIAGDGSVGSSTHTATAVPGTPWMLHMKADAEPAAVTAAWRWRALAFSLPLVALAMFFAWGVGRSAELERRVAERTRDLATENSRLAERERFGRELLRRLIDAQENERKRVARELHDELSQTLAALGLAVEAADRQQLSALVRRMNDELRRLIVDLRPSVLDDLGLASAIRWCVERHLTAKHVAARCEIDEIPASLPAEVETAIFRAVQEAIVNIDRHAEAEMALIQVSMDGSDLVVEIEDDGKGFDPAAVGRDPGSLRGVGLLGMRERIEIAGGTLRVDSEPGSGTRVLMRVPVAPAKEDVCRLAS